MPRILHILPHPGGGAETYIDVLESLDDYEHRRVPLSSSREPLRALPSISVRRRAVAEAARNADLVHVHGDTSAILAPHPRETPMVWTTHGLHLLRRTTGVPKRLVLRAIGGAVRFSSATICSSRREHDELAALLDRTAARDRLRTIVAGVPDQGKREMGNGVRKELGIGSDTMVALFAAELEPRKAPLVAVNSTLEARRAGADLVLLVAGDGSQLPDVRDAADEGVRVLGFRRDLDRLMAAADVFVLPSTREGLSLALLEAMSRSLVPVVAAGAGNPEAVGDAGIVVEPGDVQALATALAGLAGDPEERTRLGAAARERQVSEFGVDRFLREVAGVYERALAERR